MKVSVEQFRKEINQPLIFIKPVAEEEQARAEAPILEKITRGNIIGSDVNLDKRKEMIQAKGLEPVDFAYERAIGKNDSLYSNFAELITLTKRKVGRIVVKENNKIKGYATGFMVSKNVLLTNWHVFKNARQAVESEIQFFYEYDVLGHPVAPVIFKFDTTHFLSNEELDYCFVAVHPVDLSGKISLDTIGYLYLDLTHGKIGDVNVEKLNIIHHPQGDFKQISIRENLFVDINNTKIFYETDTAPGSSGSPVFNDQWQVVGLHHRSVPKMSADGKDYLDKNGAVIPVIDGKIDNAKIVWLKNEGIRISVILNHLAEKYPGNPIVTSIAKPPREENLQCNVKDDSGEAIEGPAIEKPVYSQDIIINIPTNALQNKKALDISLSQRDVAGSFQIAPEPNYKAIDPDTLFEIAKVEKEQAVDFSACTGYDPQFLGYKIPLPQPRKSLMKEIARLSSDTIELKYFKYSVIFNAVTRLPVISAINVEGDASQRLDDSKRNDDWLRDKRIDIEAQLTDKFYRKSHFDKGHMSRFEDANWALTEADALRNGVYTCFYTNACPQVAALNRAGGLWGKLEKAVLEKGVKKEAGKQARMVVFNGPIFDKKLDKIFKGVVIPMQFYKIIAWLDDSDKLKATAFRFSQETLVDDVHFDERMRIEEEALDIDKDMVFKNYQCSIKNLSSLTKIDFRKLYKYDTFKADTPDEEMLITNLEDMTL